MQIYIGMVVGAQVTNATILDEQGNRLEVHLFGTSAEKLIERVKRFRGQTHVCVEESTRSAWVCATLRPHVAEVVVTAPVNETNALTAARDSWSLAERIRCGLPAPKRLGSLAARAVVGAG
jgi:hypothetical protein